MSDTWTETEMISELREQQAEIEQLRAENAKLTTEARIGRLQAISIIEGKNAENARLQAAIERIVNHLPLIVRTIARNALNDSALAE